MAHREFIDTHGIRWEVWDVHPTHVERRRQELTSRPDGPERRHVDGGPRMEVRPEFSNGWLAFQCRGERRRLAPVPAQWSQLDDDALSALCERATPIGSPRRLLE
jgi:hypothetical protein